MKLDFEYEIKSQIKIKSINLSGTVVGYYYSETGKRHQISYFKDGEKRVIYLYPEEVERNGRIENIGFKS